MFVQIPLCIFPNFLNIFTQFAKCVCPNCLMYLSKVLNVFSKMLNVFVQIPKCKMYFSFSFETRGRDGR